MNNKNNYHFQYRINTTGDVKIDTQILTCWISATMKHEAREILVDRLRYLGIPLSCIFINDEQIKEIS